MNFLDSKQINKYHNDGFLVIRNVLSENECDDLKKILKEEIQKGKDNFNKSLQEPKKTIDYNKIGDVPRMINKGILQDIAYRNSKFMFLAKDPRFVNIIDQLFEEKIKKYYLYRSTSIYKNSEITEPTVWHQDMVYWKGKPNKLTIWIPLNETTEQTGSMHYMPGTHKKLYKKILKDGHIKKDIEDYWKSTNDTVKYDAKKVTAELKKGDIVIHHACTMHGSSKNTLAQERYALIFTYQPSTDTSHHRSGPPEPIGKK